MPSDLTEDDALLMLTRRDLPQASIAALSRQEQLMRYYRAKLALVRHANTPRTASLSLLRHLYPEDFVQLSLTPCVAGDLRPVAEDAVSNSLLGVSSGEHMVLART